MKTYFVYFDQVNQTKFVISASSRDAAIRKAEREWRKEHAWPSGAYVEDVDE